ncbi:MAG: two-component sensor histidine kinase [uncultured bacterium]|nr:MAG: two-component sensor histidine kinase [uncultured bacterium]
MKRLFKSGLDFVKGNRTIISSLLLIIVIVGTLFLNSYVTINRFQENVDKTLRGKAVMAENIMEVAAMDHLDNMSDDLLKEKLEKIKAGDEEITQIILFSKDSNGNLVPIFGAEDLSKSELDSSQSKVMEENAKKFALSVNDAFAYLDFTGGVRHWNVTKSVRNEQGNIVGVLLMKLSLEESDALVEKSIIQVYLLSITAALVVLLLVLNHLRLFAFEVRARKLEEIDKMKEDFISMASHELKTPLTAISGYSELLSDSFSKKDSEDLHMARMKYVTNIEISVDRLKNLVSDLLDVSRIQQDRFTFDLKPIDLSAIIAEVVREISVTAQQKNLKLINEIKGIPLVIADQEKLKQVLINLIGNAVKYTFQGKVEVQSREDEDWVYITVADTGIGISAENLQSLFSKFYRIKSEKTANISGTGLGLWIAKEIAERMGGALSVESIEGVGSHFTLKLKKSK